MPNKGAGTVEGRSLLVLPLLVSREVMPVSRAMEAEVEVFRAVVAVASRVVAAAVASKEVMLHLSLGETLATAAISTKEVEISTKVEEIGDLEGTLFLYNGTHSGDPIREILGSCISMREVLGSSKVVPVDSGHLVQ